MAFYGVRIREQLQNKIKNFIGSKYLVEKGLQTDEADDTEILEILGQHYKTTLELLDAAGFIELKCELPEQEAVEEVGVSTQEED